MESLLNEPIACPWCEHSKFYRHKSRPTFTCANSKCRRTFSMTTGTIVASKKKPLEWYERIIELYKQGMNPLHIAKTMNANHKSVSEFVRKYQAAHVAPEEVANRKRYRIEPPGQRPCNVRRMERSMQNVAISS